MSEKKSPKQILIEEVQEAIIKFKDVTGMEVSSISIEYAEDYNMSIDYRYISGKISINTLP